MAFGLARLTWPWKYCRPAIEPGKSMKEFTRGSTQAALPRG